MPSLNPTGYSKTNPSASGYNVDINSSTDVLLLQNGDDLLLQDGIDSILLELGRSFGRTNYAKTTPNATNYGSQVAS